MVDCLTKAIKSFFSNPVVVFNKWLGGSAMDQDREDKIELEESSSLLTGHPALYF